MTWGAQQVPPKASHRYEMRVDAQREIPPAILSDELDIISKASLSTASLFQSVVVGFSNSFG